jgi:hypothetical protein
MVSSLHYLQNNQWSTWPDQGAVGRQPLSQEQVKTVNDILAEYDPESVTRNDMQAINQAFRDADIRRGSGLREAITAAGFDAEALRQAGTGEGAPPPGAGPGGPGDAGPAGASGIQALREQLTRLARGELNEQQQNDLFVTLNQLGLQGTGSLVDTNA